MSSKGTSSETTFENGLALGHVSTQKIASDVVAKEATDTEPEYRYAICDHMINYETHYNPDVIVPYGEPLSNGGDPDSSDKKDTRVVDAIMLSLSTGKPVEEDGVQTLSYYDMKMLMDNPTAVIVLNYTYNDWEYKVTLYGSKVVADPSIPWYGPLYLAGKYGNGDVYAETDTYVIANGDTLTEIAEKNNTTVGALLILNTSITNKDLIFAGKTLQLK